VRYTYLTPPSVSDTLLFFDQGWKEEDLPKTLRLRTAVRIVPITRSASMVKIDAEKRASRIVELEAKEQGGEALTSHEKSILTRLKNPKPPIVRPTTYGPFQNEPVEGSDDEVIIVGGPVKRTPTYKLHRANILANQNRHFGQRSAKPSKVFREAVEVAAEAKAKEMVAQTKRGRKG
jgi:hypothetical protein